MKRIDRLIEEDIHIPSLEPKVWSDFLRRTGLMKIWQHSTAQYQQALIDYTAKHNIELLHIMPCKELSGGYVFRFGSNQEKLAFMLKLT